MTNKKSTGSSDQNSRRSDVKLDSRYGAIGISAVAAALQFKCDAKNPAYAPAESQQDDDEQPSGFAA